MKLNRFVWVLLLALAGSTAQLPAQSTEADRKAFEVVKARAEKGDTEAQIGLAALYSRGIGVTRDPAKAVKWLRKAAEAGVARAQCLLALDYANGEGVKMDKVEAARWLKRAADQGLAEAQQDLGLCFANGDGVERSDVEAANWYRKAGTQGLPDAQCALGTCYLEGTGVPKDIPKGSSGFRWRLSRALRPRKRSWAVVIPRAKASPRIPCKLTNGSTWRQAGGDVGDDARVDLAMTERFLTPEQVAEGQRLAREFKPHKGPAPSHSPTPGPSATAPTNAAPNWAAVPTAASSGGVVNVSAGDADCEIFVDGGFVGNTPARVKLAAGSHVVEVKKAGFKDYRRQLQINDGSELTLRAVLEKQ